MIRILRLFLLLLWVLAWFLPVALLARLKKRRMRGNLFQFICKGILRISNVRVQVIGAPAVERPLLMVSNHLSYMDIPVLGSAVDVRFVPKSEIADWPIIGAICNIVEAVYVDRRPGKIHEGNNAIRAMLAQGEIVALYPEATTGDGKRLLPFKPAFFESAGNAAVQPVAVHYKKIGGLPIGYSQWPLIAWYGDMSLLPHIWSFLKLGRVDVEIVFLPVLPSASEGRKILSSQAHRAIEAVLTGEEQEPALAQS